MFSSKPKQKPQPQPQAEKIMSKNQSQNLDTLIGQTTKLKGDLQYSGAMYVDGSIEGSLIAENENANLTISETGRVNGTIKAGNIVINGNIEGDVTASGKIEVASKARINGNIYYNNIEMEAGSQVNGQLIYQGKQEPNKSNKGKDGK